MPDTGSYETWVNPNCSQGAAFDPLMCEHNMHYDINKSQLGREVNETWHIKYGTGEALGNYVWDRFYYRHEDIGVRQKFGMASDSVAAVAGIMGLGYGYGYTMDYYNVLDTLVVNSYINGPIFSSALGRISEGLSMSLCPPIIRCSQTNHSNF
jgi:aspartyl protease